MGKLIDSEYLKEDMKRYGWEHVDSTVTEYVDGLDIVEAILKAEYENHLKADLMAMLEQLDSEIQEQIAFMGDGEETNGMKRADNLVKDKINALKQSIWQDNYNGKKE